MLKILIGKALKSLKKIIFQGEEVADNHIFVPKSIKKYNKIVLYLLH